MKLFEVVTIEKALDTMISNFNLQNDIEEVSIIEAIGRYLAEDIYSDVNVPHFRKSLVDGYAVLSQDVVGASESTPVPINLIGESFMGKILDKDLEEEECVYVPTGGMVPNNCEGVVMIEYTDKLDESTILVQKGVAFNENIVEIGEDIKKEEQLYKTGRYINERDLGVLAGANRKTIKVYKRLNIGIISTGDEILELKEDICDAKIKDINTYILYGQMKSIGCNPIIYPPAKDKLKEIIDTLDKASKECDIVLISGGSSVGKKDETIKAIESFDNSEIYIEGIAIKPGKPTIIGKINEKMIIGLPGHPLSCGFVVESIVKKYIHLLYGESKEKYIVCEFKYNYHKAKGKEEFLAVDIIEEDGLVCIPLFSKSTTIKSFAKCDGYIKIDRDVEGIKKGDKVKVYIFNA